jgi:Phage integrase, N-terminal SAM-like domain
VSAQVAAATASTAILMNCSTSSGCAKPPSLQKSLSELATRLELVTAVYESGPCRFLSLLINRRADKVLCIYKGVINVHLLSTSSVVTWGLNGGHAYPQSVGRPSLSVGTAGRVRTYRTGTGWRARTLYRDYDGITRDLERAGKTRGAAERALAEALRDRVRISGTDVISGDTRVAVLYKTWFSQLVDHSPTTTAAYEYIANRHIIPALGSLRVRELSVGTIHRFLRSVADHYGAATAKICKSILSGICGLATRHDALDRNLVP